MFVRVDILREGNEQHPFSIGRYMREPIMILIKGQLLLAFAIGFHSPDLHGAGDIRIVIDVFAVGRIFRSVHVGMVAFGQQRLFIILQGDFIQVIVG